MPLIVVRPFYASHRHGYGPGAISYLNTKKPDQAYLGSILVARAQARKAVLTSRAASLRVNAAIQIPISNGFDPQIIKATPFEPRARLLVYQVASSRASRVSFTFDSQLLIPKARTALTVSALRGSRCAAVIPGNSLAVAKPSNLISI